MIFILHLLQCSTINLDCIDHHTKAELGAHGNFRASIIINLDTAGHSIPFWLVFLHFRLLP
jgi:hypothetical protein